MYCLPVILANGS